MIDKIKKIAHFFLDKPINRILDIDASKKISCHLKDVQNKKEKNLDKDIKIKVAFIVQMPEVWAQQSSMYEYLENDERFDVSIIRVPQYDVGDRKYKNYNSVKQFFSKKYPDAHFVDIFDKNGKRININGSEYDYLFYERPYNAYLPRDLRSSHMSRYTKVCYIPYTTPDYKSGVGHKAPDKEFYRYVYIGFHNSDSRIKVLYESMRKRHRRYHHYVNLGYPVLNECINTTTLPHDKCVVMWTPRWSYDSNVGGSHFLEYKDSIINLGKEIDDIKVVARPHPFTYTYMINNGYMTKKEVDEFKNNAIKNGVVFDKNKSVIDSFAETDILVSDLSSIIWQFFFQGKPVIYCPCDIPLSDELNELLKAMYIAENDDDIKKYVKEIASGNDFKKPDRQKIIDTYLSKFSNPVDNFVEYLINDYKGEI